MYIVKNDYKNCRIDFTKSKRSIYLNNNTPQDILEILFKENHPAVEMKKKKKVINKNIDE